MDDGKLEWEELANVALNALDRIVDKLLEVNSASGGGGGGIGGFLANAFSWIFSAKGNAFSRGNVIPFAKGGVVSQPTVFPMAHGAGVMGEAGPEGILPLKRNSAGQLGVIATGGAASNNLPQSSNVNIYVDVTGARGNGEIEEMVASGVDKGLRQYDRALPDRLQQINHNPRKRA